MKVKIWLRSRSKSTKKFRPNLADFWQNLTAKIVCSDKDTSERVFHVDIKSEEPIYTTILDAKKPACFRYESGKEKITDSGIKYFHVVCRYLNFNGHVFGETSTAMGIPAFKGVKRIDRPEAFPLEFLPRQKEIMKYMVKCGTTFVSLMGQHHVQYRGNAFYRTDGSYVEVPVDSRIIIDVSYFRKVNPNYVRPNVNHPIQVCKQY
jgi:hypothetical protein